MNIQRRELLCWGTKLAAGAALGFTGLTSRRASALTGFGPLVADPLGVLDLPAGFSYRIVQSTGDIMSDGRPVRARPDGMAAFAGVNNTTILMRNHEIGGSGGGVSRLVFDGNLALVSSNDVLTGTSTNCAGGPSPWGWLSCEEVASGGVWIAPTDRSTALPSAERVRIAGYGTFSHEAVAIDPTLLDAYLTEDNGGNGYLYRFRPSSPATPFAGQLQAMKVVGVKSYATQNMAVGQSVNVEWVGPLDVKKPHNAAQKKWAAIVVRGEGAWWFGGSLYFSATTNHQIFRYTPTGGTASSTGVLTMIARASLQMPDNITVAPWGDIYVAEDNGSQNHLRIVDAAGGAADFARNRIAPGDELTGVCFSPTGRALFVNMQGSGLTFVITGPFPA